MEEVKNEGPKEMTLDEWKAMQDKERTKVEFNIRKPNEGADSQWKKGYVLHKSKSEDVSDDFMMLWRTETFSLLQLGSFSSVVCLAEASTLSTPALYRLVFQLHHTSVAVT